MGHNYTQIGGKITPNFLQCIIEDCPGKLSTSAGSPLPLIGIGAPCQMCMTHRCMRVLNIGGAQIKLHRIGGMVLKLHNWSGA